MNGFYSASAVEAEGMAILLPYLEERTDRLVLNLKGPLARHLQLVTGDALVNIADELRSIEIKVERRHTGRLFLETWSNRNLEDKVGHASHGSNPGWLFHTRADVLLYYFLDTDDLYAVSVFALKRWCFGYADKPAQIYQWEEVPQKKYSQMNDTHGRCVPIERLQRDLGKGFKHCKVKQLSLLEGAAQELAA
jgi:hypothetical protein